MFFACHNGHEAVVRLLLAEDRANINLAENNGTTPLYIACYNGHEAVVRALVRAGADSADAILAARARQHRDIAAWLAAVRGASATTLARPRVARSF